MTNWYQDGEGTWRRPVDEQLLLTCTELCQQNDSLRKDLRKMREERDEALHALTGVTQKAADDDSGMNVQRRAWNQQVMVESIPMLDELDARVAKLESAVLLPSDPRGNSSAEERR